MSKIAVLTVGAKRPAYLPDHCVHVPATTRSLGQRLIAGVPDGPAWGWWRDSGGWNTALVATFGERFIVDLEPDAWRSGRSLTDAEIRAAAVSAGVTSWGYPGRASAALRPFATAGKTGLIQLYRDGATVGSAARAGAQRIRAWRRLGFEHLTGILGGAKSGVRWGRAMIEVAEGEGLGIALWGWGGRQGVQAELAEMAHERGLGRG